MATVFTTVLSVSLSGAILALLLFALKPVLRNRISKAFSYYIWMLVLLRLLIPFGYGISLPMAISAPEQPQTNANSFEEDIQGSLDGVQSGDNEGHTTVPGGNGGTQGNYEDVQGGNQPQGNIGGTQGGYEDVQGGNNGQQHVPDTGIQIPEKPQTDTEVTAPAPAVFNLWNWLQGHIGYIWIVGAVLCFGWFVASYGVFSRKIRRTLSNPDGEDLAQFDALRGRARVKLMCSDKVHIPMLMGVLHPVIVVPQDSYVAAGKRDIFCCIILHELTHYRRKDVAVKWLGIVSASIHWFNPVVYLVRREIDNACELACDEALIRNMSNQERKFYGNALLTFAGEQGRLSRVAATTICQGKKQLKDRLTSIMGYKKCSKAAIAVMLVLALVLTGCAATYVNLGTENESVADDRNTPVQKLDAATDVIPEVYLQVLHNQQGIRFGDQAVLIAEYTSPYLQKKLIECDTAEYAAVDMDGDGEKELLLKGWSDDILVLREENGTVYGYDFVFRSMYQVKLDGTYSWNSNEGRTYGYARLSFIKGNGQFQTVEVNRVESDGNNGQTKYFVANAEVSRAEYDDSVAQLSSVKELAWHSLEEFFDNIKPGEETDKPGITGNALPKLSQPEPYRADSTALQPYRAVLLDGGEFFAVDGIKGQTIDQLEQAYGAAEKDPVRMVAFAVLDLDSDDLPEVALWLGAGGNDYYGFLLLDSRENTVYGHFVNYRGFRELKTDGTFFGSAGFANNSYSRLSFTETGIAYESFIFSMFMQSNDGKGEILYGVDGKGVSEAVYRQACTWQDAKKDAPWYAFNKDNLKILLGEETELPQSQTTFPVAIRYATSQENIALQTGKSEYHNYDDSRKTYLRESIVVYTSESVTDFKFLTLELDSAAENYIATEVLYTLDTLTPERPLIICTLVEEGLSDRGFCFTDSQGVVHYYTYGYDSRNGGLLCSEMQTPPQMGLHIPPQPPAGGYIQTLFPPKNTTQYLEGMPEVLHHVAGGKEPVFAEDGTCTAPGFAIYYPSDYYYLTEENGKTYIRAIGASYPSNNEMPSCEMEIMHIPNVAPAADAKAVRNEMLASWKRVDEPFVRENGDVYMNFSNGTNWNSAIGNIDFISDGRGGTFRITSRYFFEAAEGHGMRFAYVENSFTVIDPQPRNK